MTRRPDLAELRRMTTPDLRGEIDDRLGRLETNAMDNEPSLRRKAVVLAVAVLVTGGTMFALAKAFGGSGNDLRVPGDTATEPLTGDALAESLGLIKHEWSPGQALTSTAEGIEQDGELLADCANTEPLPVQIVQEVEGHFFYCIRANTHLEAWEIAQRLKGHIPTQSELDEMGGELNGGAGESATIDVPGTGASIAVGDDFGGFQGLVLGKRALGIDNTLSDFQGDVEIKFFWASSSDGVGRYLGALEDLNKRYGGQVAVLGINVRDDDEAALALMHSVGVSFVNIADPSGDIADRFGVTRMPLGVVVDGRSNRVEAVIEGSDPGDLEAFVDQWLGTNSSTP